MIVARLAAGALALAATGCVGVIEDAAGSPVRNSATGGSLAVPPSAASSDTQSSPPSAARPGVQNAAGTSPGRTAQGNGLMTPGNVTQNPSAGAAAPGGTVATSGGSSDWDPDATNAVGHSVGTGSLDQPALGPAPIHGSKVGGSPFVLVKNWDFGSDGTITQISDLIEEFQFHDQFGTIANGTNYGAVIVAPTAETAIKASDLGLPNNRQPVEDPARPFREFTPEAIRTFVRPLSPSQTSISATKHDAGNGSFMAKWTLPKGGSRLDRDILWESRVRIPKPVKAFWFSLWTAGHRWNKGAEMDVVESFGTPNIGEGARSFHVNSVGGRDEHAYSSWSSTLSEIGVPSAQRDLSEWHTFTWIYLRDDTYQVYYDDHLVQQGTLIWTLGGSASGEELDMQFLFDFSWGHTQVDEVNISLPVSELPMTYELDYSRVYLRN